MLSPDDSKSYLYQSQGICDFWRDWYQGFLDGKPLDWELQRRVALIPDADWEKGPAHIAEKIEEIRREYDAEKSAVATRAEVDKPIQPAAAKAMAKRLAANRDAIALITAGLLAQIAEFREKVRGENHLDPDLRERLLAFLDGLTGQLEELLALLPRNAENANEETGENGVRWLRAFKVALLKNARDYVGAENVASATIPTGIILGCTGLGSLLGMPVAGTVVGGLLTGQLKPGKAVDDLLKPTKGGDP